MSCTEFTGANENEFFIISLIRVGHGVTYNPLMSLLLIVFDRNYSPKFDEILLRFLAGNADLFDGPFAETGGRV